MNLPILRRDLSDEARKMLQAAVALPSPTSKKGRGHASHKKSRKRLPLAVFLRHTSSELKKPCGIETAPRSSKGATTQTQHCAFQHSHHPQQPSVSRGQFDVLLPESDESTGSLENEMQDLARVPKAASSKLRTKKCTKKQPRSKTFFMGPTFVVHGNTTDQRMLWHILSGNSDTFSDRCLCNRFEPVIPRQIKRFVQKLSAGTRRLLDEPNAGGKSQHSEALSFELLKACFGAKLHATEMEAFRHGVRCADYIAEVYGQLVGVSVTRAMKFNKTNDPGSNQFTKEDAERLFLKKLGALINTHTFASEAGVWKCPLLHVWCDSENTVAVMASTFRGLGSNYCGQAIVMLTSAGSAIDHIIFNNEPFEFKNIKPSKQSTHRTRLNASEAKYWHSLTPSYWRELQNARENSGSGMW